MDVEKIFHMTGGIGDNSYAKNSSFQKKASDMAKHITLETLEQVCLTLEPKSLGIADLGCSSGPNTLSIIKDMVETAESASTRNLCPLQEFRVYLNDLPTNDFNSIFKSLPDFYRELKKERNATECSYDLFIAGYPGSFYGRLFPNNSLHFVYASYSFHWLSKVPPSLFDEEGKSINKGSIYICESSPSHVSEAYFAQFQEDFSLFLRSRSEELISGGRMVLIFLGRIGAEHIDRGNSFYWQLLTRSFAILVSQGKIEKEKLDSYDVHFYAASKEEIEDGIRKEGSFELESLEMFEVVKKSYRAGKHEGCGEEVAKAVRAVQESMIINHFGEAIVEPLFDIFAKLVDEEVAKEEIKPITFLAVLKKL